MIKYWRTKFFSTNISPMSPGRCFRPPEMSGFNWNRPETCRKRTGTCMKTPDITGPWKQYSGTDFSGFSRWFPMISGGNQQELGGIYRKNPEISRSGILLPWNRGNAREPAVSRAGCLDLGSEICLNQHLDRRPMTFYGGRAESC